MARLTSTWEAQRRWLGPVAVLLAFAAVAFGLALAAYPATFSHFADYDDEGFLLLSLRSFIADGHLYSGVYTHYGPFYYEFWGSIFKLGGIGVSHDSGGFATVIVWLAGSTLAGLATYLGTRRLLAALAVQLLVFRNQSIMIAEPMAAGALVFLLLACLAFAAFWLKPQGSRPGLAAAIGVLLGAMLLVKANLGALAVISAGLALVTTYPLLRSRRLLRPAVEILFVITPLLLTVSDLSQSWARALAVHVAVAALAVVLVMRTLDAEPARERRELRAMLIGFAALVIVAIGFVLVTGTTPRGLVRGLVIFPLQQSDTLTYPLILKHGILAADFVLLGVCLLYCRFGARSEALGWDIAIAIGRIAAAAFIALMAADLLGLDTVYASRPQPSGLALAWVALIPPRREAWTAPVSALAPRLLVALAVLQVLHAYPVAGSQVHWGTFLLIPVAGICFVTGIRELAAIVPGRRLLVTAAGLAASLAIVLLVADRVLIREGDQSRDLYDSGVGLRLPGSSRLHLNGDVAQVYEDVAATIRRRCGTLLSFPGLGSFNLWSRRDPPDDFNVNDWMYLFDDEIQSQVVADSRRSRRLCLLRYPQLATTYRHPDGFPDRPLLRFVRSGFREPRQIGPYELLSRRTAGRGER